MKQYTKPTATIVELSVKENIAALPAALSKTETTATISMGSDSVLLTTYNLTTTSTSNVVS